MTTKTISENKSCEMISSRLRGCLYGQAIGDALGLGAEAMTKNEMAKNYPNGLVHYGDIVQDYHRSRWRHGDWTDDTDMMLCIADAIIEDNDSKSASRDSNREDNDNNSEINSSESAPRSLFFFDNYTGSVQNGVKNDYHTIARHFKAWTDGTPMGIGIHTRNVLAFGNYAKKPFQGFKRIWDLSNKQPAANGGVMRTSIVGLLPGDVRKNAEEICRLTHYDPRCVGSCVIVSELIHALVYSGALPTFQQMKETAKQYDERVIEYVDMAYNSNTNCATDERSVCGLHT